MMIPRSILRESRNLYICSLCNNGFRPHRFPVALRHARRWVSDSSNDSPPKSSGWGGPSSFVPRTPKPSTDETANSDSPAPPASSGWGSSAGFTPRTPAKSAPDTLSDHELAARRALLSSSVKSAPKWNAGAPRSSQPRDAGRSAQAAQAGRRPAGEESDGRPHRPNWGGPGSNPRGRSAWSAESRDQGAPRTRSDKGEGFWDTFGASGGNASGRSENDAPNWNSLPRRPRRNGGGSFDQAGGSSWTPKSRQTPAPDGSGIERLMEHAKSDNTRHSKAKTDQPQEDWAARYSSQGRRAPAEQQARTTPKPQQPAKEKEDDSDLAWGSRSYNAREERPSGKSKKSRGGRSSRRRDDDDGEIDEEAEMLAERKRRQKQEEKAARKAGKRHGDERHNQIFLPEYISVTDLARALKMSSHDFLLALEEYGFEDLGEDSIFTGETAGLVAQEFGFDVKVDDGMARDIRPQPEPEDWSSVPPRPPVVAIMGHVDHGKTTLLDYLRKSSIVAGEHGGITQHIGAFVVNLSSGKSITFLDTPGHAAFLNMRQRGAEVTDIVILVVAADDSVMPQTIEAIKHARDANVPMIVAITKCDKEDARIDLVKSDLANHGVEIEDHGGDVQVVPVSGRTGQGMSDLEENIVTLSEILDVRGEPNILAEGWVLEASVKPVGKAATVLIKRGTLRIGDYLVCGTAWARVRMLRNEAGQEIEEAPPGSPVEVLGWRDELPQAGDRALQPPDEARARSAIDYRREMQDREKVQKQIADTERQRRELEAKAKAEAQAAGEAEEAEEGEGAEAEGESSIATVNFIVRADVAGSVEAVTGTILEIGNNEVRPRILRSGAGAIIESDVEYAAMSRSIIINFNNSIPGHVKNQAEEAGVKILDRSVIYHVIDDVKAELSAKLPDAVSQRVLGEAEVLQVFPINVKGRVYKNIAGCRIRNGALKKTDAVRIYRKGKKIFDGKLESLKHGKKDVAEMKKGSECGIGCIDFQDLEVGDQVQTYEEVREKRTL